MEFGPKFCRSKSSNIQSNIIAAEVHSRFNSLPACSPFRRRPFCPSVHPSDLLKSYRYTSIFSSSYEVFQDIKGIHSPSYELFLSVQVHYRTVKEAVSNLGQNFATCSASLYSPWMHTFPPVTIVSVYTMIRSAHLHTC
jgi:hypothetical protein